jgi:hypothetical protein
MIGGKCNMTGFDNHHIAEINPEKMRAAQMEFIMSEQLAKTVVPLLMPQPVYNRLSRGSNLRLVTPPIELPLTEKPELPAKEAAWERLPFNWQLNESRFYVRGITPGQNKLYTKSRKKNDELFMGAAWLFHLQKKDAEVLGKVVHGPSQPRPGIIQPLRLGVILSRYDRSLMMNESQINKKLADAQEKLQEIADDAYVYGKPIVVSKPVNNQ